MFVCTKENDLSILLILDNKGYVIVSALVQARRYHAFGAVKLYVDTGSPESFLSEEDALRLKFPLTKLKNDKFSLMGGTKMQTAETRGAFRGILDTTFFMLLKESILTFLGTASNEISLQCRDKLESEINQQILQ